MVKGVEVEDVNEEVEVNQETGQPIKEEAEEIPEETVEEKQADLKKLESTLKKLKNEHKRTKGNCTKAQNDYTNFRKKIQAELFPGENILNRLKTTNSESEYNELLQKKVSAEREFMDVKRRK